jgi:hypothetical protein
MSKSDSIVDSQQKEALVSMTALYFIEEHRLLDPEQLDDAKKSLQALFLRTSGEETMLRKLIDILKTTKQIHQSFASIGNVLTGISRGVQLVDGKVAAYKQALSVLAPTAEENKAFAGPFLSFSQSFLQKIDAFENNLRQYVDLKETEARYASIYRIAIEARERLKHRLTGMLGAETPNEVESKIRQSVISTFDYSESETNLRYAQRETRNKGDEIVEQLDDIKAMCQMAKNPSMREQAEEAENNTVSSYSVIPNKERAAKKPAATYDDVFTLFTTGIRQHPRLLELKNIVLELFKLYQHSYGLFTLDCSNLNKAIETMMSNTEAYFGAKEEDRDIKSKKEKLKRIEGLIPFLERAAQAVPEEERIPYNRFSRKLSDIVSEKRAPWSHIAEDLLRAKVQAEADLSTRM